MAKQLGLYVVGKFCTSGHWTDDTSSSIWLKPAAVSDDMSLESALLPDCEAPGATPHSEPQLGSRHVQKSCIAASSRRVQLYMIAVLGLLSMAVAFKCLSPKPMNNLIKLFERADRVVVVDGQHYHSVQYFGFSLFTAPGTAADGCFKEGTDIDQCYLGSSVVQEDLAKRTSIMLEAIDRLFASDIWDRSTSTLKIFMLPEFYWRGPQGAYRMDHGLEQAATPAAHWLDQKFSEDRFKHWLIVDGTVILAKSADADYVQVSQRPSENISYYNFAPVHVGGTNLTFLRLLGLIFELTFLLSLFCTARRPSRELGKKGEARSLSQKAPNKSLPFDAVLPLFSETAKAKTTGQYLQSSVDCGPDESHAFLELTNIFHA